MLTMRTGLEPPLWTFSAKVWWTGPADNKWDREKLAGAMAVGAFRRPAGTTRQSVCQTLSGALL